MRQNTTSDTSIDQHHNDNAILWPYSSYLICRQHNFIYCPIPKVACSSIKRWMLNFSDQREEWNQYDMDNPDKYKSPHMIVEKLFSFRHNVCAHECAELVTNKKIFKFIVVRNPYKRVLSAYVDKFIKPKKHNIFGSPSENVIIDVYKHHNSTPDFDRRISFNEFIDYIYRTPDSELDQHWKPQHLFFGNTRFNFVGKLEEISKWINLFEHITKIKLANTKLQKTNYSNADKSVKLSANTPASEFRDKNILPYLDNLYNKDNIKLIAERYGDDFNKLDYKTTIDMQR